MAKTKKIGVLAFRVGKRQAIEYIDNDLVSAQKFVGGFIETHTILNAPKIVLVCNEEGALKGLPENRYVAGLGTIVGDFFVCQLTPSGNFTSISDKNAMFLNHSDVFDK